MTASALGIGAGRSVSLVAASFGGAGAASVAGAAETGSDADSLKRGSTCDGAFAGGRPNPVKRPRTDFESQIIELPLAASAGFATETFCTLATAVFSVSALGALGVVAAFTDWIAT